VSEKRVPPNGTQLPKHLFLSISPPKAFAYAHYADGIQPFKKSAFSAMDTGINKSNAAVNTATLTFTIDYRGGK